MRLITTGGANSWTSAFEDPKMEILKYSINYLKSVYSTVHK